MFGFVSLFSVQSYDSHRKMTFLSGGTFTSCPRTIQAAYSPALPELIRVLEYSCYLNAMLSSASNVCTATILGCGPLVHLPQACLTMRGSQSMQGNDTRKMPQNSWVSLDEYSMPYSRDNTGRKRPNDTFPRHIPTSPEAQRSHVCKPYIQTPPK